MMVSCPHTFGQIKNSGYRSLNAQKTAVNKWHKEKKVEETHAVIE